MEQAQGKLGKAADRIAAQSPDTVELSTEVLAARDQFQTNARVMHSADEMQKTLLNLLA